MSQEVDQRVVEMRFDNANFEKNTRKTVASIDKLMEKLQFKGAEKGFEKLDKAAKDVDLGVIARSVETLEERFSALNVVATAALVNITNRVVNAGEKIVKSLTLDGMMKGFGEYETQINSVQTILANTADKGTTLNQVNKALDELNRYADQTIYNFTEMTRNIGTFTAAGVGLNKSVAAIKGIANLGAISGSSSQQVSTAMYQLSQALASGTVKLQDWNSVTNAGMGGRIFQNSLMETARVHGIAIDEMVAKEGSFRETLKNGWLSADILTETLQKFTGDLDREALLAIGYTEEQTEAILKLGETARNAATQVKTLTQLKDTLGEAVQSGWTQTWEIIAGDFEEAKRLYTKISDALGGIIERSAENRNERLSQGLSNGLKQLQNEMGESAELFTYTLENVALAKGLVTEDALLEAGSLGAALEGSQVSADLLWDSIAATVTELNRLQSMSDEELNALGYDRNAVEKQIQAFDKLGQKIEEGTIDLDEFAKKMGQISGRGHLIQSLENVWTAITKITGAVKGAFDEIFPPSSGEQIYTFAQRLDDLTKKLIISDETAEKIKMVFKGVFSVLKIGTTALQQVGRIGVGVFGVLVEAVAPVGKALLSIGAGLGSFVEGVQEILASSGTVEEKLERIKEACKKMLAPLNELTEALRSTRLWQAVEALLAKGGKVENLLQRLYNGAKKLVGGVAALAAGIAGGSMTLLGGLNEVLKGIAARVGTAEELGIMLAQMPKRLNENLHAFASGFRNSTEIIREQSAAAAAPMHQFFNALAEGASALDDLDIYRVLSLLDVALLAVAINQVGKAMVSLKKMLETPIAKLLNSVSGTFNALTDAIKKAKRYDAVKVIASLAAGVLLLAGAMLVLSRVPEDRLNQVATITLAGVVVLAAAAKLLEPTARKFEVSLNKTVDSLKNNVFRAAALWGTAAALGAFAAATYSVISGVRKLMEVIQQGEIEDSIAGIVMVLSTLVTAFWGFNKAIQAVVVSEKTMRPKTILSAATAMVMYGAAVNVLAQAVKSLAVLDDWENVRAGTTAVIVLMGVMSAAAMAIKKWGTIDFQNGAGLMGMVSAILIASKAFKTIAKIQFEDPNDFFASVTVMAGLMTGITLMAKYAKPSLQAAGAMMVMAGSISVLTGAFALLTMIPMEKVMDGFGVLFSLLVSTGGTLGLLSMLGAGKALESATAMYTLSGGLLVLAGAVAVYAALGDKAWNALVQCGAALGGITVAVLAMSLMKTGALDAAWTMNTIAGGLLKLSVGCALFALVPWRALASAAVALGSLFAVLLVGGGLAAKFPPLTIALTALGKAFGDFGAGAVKLAGSMAVLGILSMFAGPICQAIISAAPDITDALIVVVTSLCETIIACAEPLAMALAALATALYKSIVILLENIWEMTKPALNDLWGKFTGWVDTKTGELPGLLKEKISGMLQWLNPFAPFMDELKNGDSVMAGLYQMLFQGGKKATEGLAEGVSDQEAAKEAADAAQANAQTVIDTTTKTFDEHSPSKVMYEKGYFAAMGLAEGIADASAADAVRRATSQLAESVPQQFCKDLDIHSPSWRMRALAMMVPAGMAEGIADGAPLPLAATGRIGQMYERRLVAMESPLYQLGKNVGESGSNGISDGFTNAWNKFKNALGLDENFLSGYDEIRKQVDDALANAGEALGGQSGGGKGKTAAEAAAEKYTAELKANKAMQDALTKEAALWDLQHGDAAADEELLAKRSETAAEKIELQTERVAIAQAQFDELTKKAGKNDAKTREAYNTLLDEQAELEKLKQSRYEDVWKDLLTRYENETSTAESEYELWATMYQDSATVTEQSNKQMELVNKKIHAQAKVLAVAEKEYTELKEAFGKEHQDTQTAYRKYLQEQTRQQELINELEKAQLDQFDNQIARYEKETRILQNRHQMLDKIYGDGDLSGREDAYKEAVEKYGQGSKEARKAATQGTMSAILGVSKALSSMRYSLKNLTEYQKKYDQVVKDSGENSNAALDALSQLQGEQYNLVGFAENLADAFDMTDMGKKAMMQLGYTISKNWKSIQNGFSRAWKQVEKNMPQTVQNLSMALNLAMSEGAAETAASFIQTIVAAVSGDYATAVVSALNTVLGFMNTEFGKKVMDGLGNLMMDAVNALSKGSGIGKWIKSLFGGGTALAGAAAQTGQIAQNTGAIAGAVGNAAAGAAQIASSGGLFAKIAAGAKGLMGSLAAAAGGIGAKLTTLLGSVAGSLGAAGPVGLAVAALAAGGGLVIANWDKVKEWFGKFGDWMGKTFGKLWEGAKGFVKGAIDVGKNILSGLWNGVKSVAGGLWNGIKSIGKGIISGFKNIFGIHSPSTVFAGMGRYMMLGLENGILNEGKGVYQSLEEVSKSALDTAWDCAQRLAKATGESMEYQPTVQPIVDLSRAQAGATWMEENLAGGVRKIGFDLGRTSQLAEMVTRRDMARREAMWQKDQPKPGEMSNKDIVEAIQTLGGRIDGVSEAVGRMKLTLNGKKVVGGIINDVDEGLGKIAQRHKR